ncbi:hypothetical protein N7G274_001740 [Stereocaulon virgatum]|uniref:Heavy metal tolerance protein n=1 Tax=Stereocaulon virgatum TaxID=373712 RepID=A0ABR4AME3_9LECA
MDKLYGLRHMLHYAVPAIVLVYYVLAITVSILTLQNLKFPNRKAPRKVLPQLVAFVLLSYVVEAALLLTETFANGGLYSSTDTNVFALSSVLVWAILLVCFDSKSSIWYPDCGTWLITIVAEIVLFALTLNHGITPSTFAYPHLVVQACRLIALVLLPTVLFSRYSEKIAVDEESAPLLGQRKDLLADVQISNEDSKYGSMSASSDEIEVEDDDDSDSEATKAKKEKELKDRLLANGNWFTYARSFSIFVPLVWPTKQPLLYVNLIGVFVCIACTRALNILEPRQFGIVLDRLSVAEGVGSVKSLALQVMLYIFYGWFSSHILSTIQSRLWLPIDQNARQCLKKTAYNHIMDLSLDFHSDKQSGELYESISQGSSVIQILKTILFELLPVLADLVVIVAYLYHVFGPYLALILATTTTLYVWSSNLFISKQAAIHREGAHCKRKESQTMYDSVGGWNTVSYFNRIPYEKRRYSDVVDSLVVLRLHEWSIYLVADFVEGTLFQLGLMCTGLLAIYQIVHSKQPIGNFAMLVSLWSNVQGNIEQLVGTRREFLEYLIDAEALRELLQKESSVKDGPQSFAFRRGAVHLRDVKFSYDGEKPVIKDFDFYAKAGQRIALVGESGSGKSTILKLLFRYYDVQRGAITVDDQNVKDMTLESLRSCIGVVPQDPSLFNDTIMQNVRYSKLDATDEEIYEACKAASIHDKILQFPKGYASKVGEKGVKLSGGELQRIAIARVILKDPRIILLDEATSAVDTETESRIQEALQKLTHGRTTFTVAHRLSTVSDADIILVIKDGSIVEQGPPQELLKAKGEYFDLWSKQVGLPAISEDGLKPGDTEDSKPRNLEDTSKAHQCRDKCRLSGSSSSSGKSLRATAPEFVPQEPVFLHQRGTFSQSPHDPGTTAHQQSYDSTPGYLLDNAGANAKMKYGKNKSPEKDNIVTASEQPSDGATPTSQSSNGSQPQSKKTKRYLLIQRCSNSKSEPSSANSEQSQINGTNEGQSTSRLQSRQYSAPSDPLSGVVRAREGAHGRKRRRRNLRIKKNDSTAVHSGGTSSAWSGDTLHLLSPHAAQSTPDGSTIPINESDAVATSRGSVHFAPGV